jgi:hypothetical protein
MFAYWMSRKASLEGGRRNGCDEEKLFSYQIYQNGSRNGFWYIFNYKIRNLL